MTNKLVTTDALIIGAGPCGLFQAFELGLLGISCHIVDSLAYPGGQCIELYPDKPIYDIPAIPACTGRQLIDNLLEQIKPFAPQFHFNQQVINLIQQGNQFLVQTQQGKQFLTKTIFIATGVGVFKPQPLRIPGIEQFENKQLFYQVDDSQKFTQQNLVIVGGGDSAVDWAIEFASSSQNPAKKVSLIHRRNVFTAMPAKIAKIEQLCQQQKLELIIGQVTNFKQQNQNLTEIEVLCTDSSVRNISLDKLLVFFGMSPKLGNMENWGLELYRKQIMVNCQDFSTNIKGIFAIGDINYYPGKKKLILCGFHEATLAAYSASTIINPENPAILQYTTTNTKVHKLLGVAN